MGKSMQYYERNHGPLHLEDEFTNRDYALARASEERKQGKRVQVKKSRRGSTVRWQLWTD